MSSAISNRALPNTCGGIYTSQGPFCTLACRRHLRFGHTGPEYIVISGTDLYGTSALTVESVGFQAPHR